MRASVRFGRIEVEQLVNDLLLKRLSAAASTKWIAQAIGWEINGEFIRKFRTKPIDFVRLYFDDMIRAGQLQLDRIEPFSESLHFPGAGHASSRGTVGRNPAQSLADHPGGAQTPLPRGAGEAEEVVGTSAAYGTTTGPGFAVSGRIARTKHLTDCDHLMHRRCERAPSPFVQSLATPTVRYTQEGGDGLSENEHYRIPPRCGGVSCIYDGGQFAPLDREVQTRLLHESRKVLVLQAHRRTEEYQIAERTRGNRCHMKED